MPSSQRAEGNSLPVGNFEWKTPTVVIPPPRAEQHSGGLTGWQRPECVAAAFQRDISQVGYASQGTPSLAHAGGFSLLPLLPQQTPVRHQPHSKDLLILQQHLQHYLCGAERGETGSLQQGICHYLYNVWEAPAKYCQGLV